VIIDKKRADHAVEFIQALKHTKGRWAGRPFLLEPWQEKIIRDIFGQIDETGYRKIRTAYMEVARKNGKSELAAAVALYLLFGDGEIGAEIYSAAGDKDQASIVFNVAAQMCRLSGLENRCKILDSTKRIIIPGANSIYRVLSAEHATKHGFNASGIIFDELHAQPNRHLWDVLTSSGGTRTQPLTFTITTAGYDRNSICFEQHDYAERISKGGANDPTFYSAIYSVPDDADWTDEEIWPLANPALGTFRDIREMRTACEKAKVIPAYQNTFRRLYLNQWTSQESRWLDLTKWMESAGEVHEEDLMGEPAYCGLDLSSTIDISAFVMVFPDGEGSYDIWPTFWIPEERIRERSDRDRVHYDTWVRDGFMRTTPGNGIDYRYIRRDIEELGEKFNIREIAFDRWGATEIIQYLEDDGFTVVQFGQGYASMNSPTKELMKLVLGRNLRHGNHPVLTWMADNLVVKQDPAGNLKPDKQKSIEKIDGMVALIMGLDRAIRNQGSIYDERGFITL